MTGEVVKGEAAATVTARTGAVAQELSSSRFTMIIGITAVLFFLGLLPLEAIPEIPVDIDSKPFFIPLVLLALLPAGRPGLAIGLGVALGEFLRDMMEGYELDDPIGFVGYVVAFALTSQIFGKQPPGRLLILCAGLLSGFVQAIIEASSFLLFGEESFWIVIQSTIGNTILHGVVWGAIPAFFLIPVLQGRFEHYLGFSTKGEVLERAPMERSTSGFAPSAQAAVWLADTSFRYPSGDVPALRGVSLEIRAGEVLGVMGPSLSGKSTLCRVLAEIAPRGTGGELVGDVVLGAGAVDIGYVADTPAAMMTRTHALSEVEAALEHLGLSGKERTARALDVLGEVGIGEAEARRYIWELPGSRQLLVALAAAIASRPRLLVLDELAAEMDASGLAVLRRIITAHCAGGGAVCMVDNDVDRQWDWSHRLAVLDNGSLVRIGPTRDVLADRGLMARIGFCRPSELLAREIGPQGPRPQSKTVAGADREVLLAVEGLDFAYPQGPHVLDAVSFTLASGEIAGIAAPSGAGKSTLARLLGGLLEVQDGTIALGRDDSDSKAIAIVMDDPSTFFSEATIAAEMTQILRRDGFLDDEIAVRIAELAARFGLEELLERDPGRLSAGAARRAHVAAMLARRTRLLVLDEVATRLDPAERGLLAGAVRGFAQGGGAVLVLDHDLEFLAQMCDRIALLDEARLADLGLIAAGLDDHQAARLARADVAIPQAALVAARLGVPFASRAALEGLAQDNGGQTTGGEGQA